MKRHESVYAILQEILTEQQNLLRKISAKMYTQNIPSLDGSTIGGHTRHIIEFLEILLNSYHTNQINYDERQRNLELEKNPEKAVKTISEILSGINLPNKNLIMHQTVGNISLEIPTNFFRELLYNIEHCIHHQALIKVAFNEIKMSHLLNKNFGIAPSTVQYRETQNLN
ncbi:DinB family protein [Chryseobacterium sp. GP-SGM7]|uniref:DinB family protein n=1 Tax=Chryseobacterium sp. GP-SGM7 TaxID=3411323 RepID=UPI003B939179